MISIKGLSKAAVLLSLYNAAAPAGYGFIDAKKKSMTFEEAGKEIEETPNLYFDYVGGRCLKVSLCGDEFDPTQYDRDWGRGAAANVINNLRSGNIEAIEQKGAENQAKSIAMTTAALGSTDSCTDVKITLGLFEDRASIEDGIAAFKK